MTTLGVGAAFLTPVAGCGGKAKETEYCTTPRAISPLYPGDGKAVDDHDQGTWLHGTQITISVPNKAHKLGGIIIGYENNSSDPQSSQAVWHDSNVLPTFPEEQGKTKTVALGIGERSVAFSVQLTAEVGSDFCASAANAVPAAVFSQVLSHEDAMAGGWQPSWP